MNIRLVALDLDGTFLDNEGQLPPHGSRSIKRASAQGIRIVISTTRNYSYVRRLCSALALSDPIICSNGAYVYASPTGALWRELRIPLDIAEMICQMADENGWELVTGVGETTYFRQRPGQALGPWAEDRIVVEKNRAAIVDKPHQILTWQPEAIEALRALCLKEFPAQCRTEIYYRPTGEVYSMGIFARGADKGSALHEVLTKLDINVDSVMAIGDNANDLPMFEFAAHRVAMGNGTEEIKQAANIIAPTNEEEGVAWALERYVA